MSKKNKQEKKAMRHTRIRARISGTKERPRLSVFKSNRHFYIQLIDDSVGKTLISVNDKELSVSGKKPRKSNKVLAYELGKSLAKKAGGIGIKSAVFDRGGYKFHGAVLQIASGAREGGLKL